MDRFVNDIMPDVPGCPKATIKAHVLKTAIKFCVETWVWQADEEIDAASGDDTILLSSPTSGSTVIGIPSITMDEIQFSDYTRENNTITFDESLSQACTFDVTKAYSPSRSADGLPDLLYDKWFEAIEAGAKASLLLMPGKPWTNPQLSAVHMGTFLYHVGQAKLDSMGKNKASTKTVTQVGFK